MYQLQMKITQGVVHHELHNDEKDVFLQNSF